MDIYSITNHLNEQAETVINTLGDEEIAVYIFLNNEFLKGDITSNQVFQFVFRSFYRLDNAGLTPEFKDAYFQLMQRCRNINTIDPHAIIEYLYQYKRRKGDHSIQFSFTTKMINMIDPTYPIYDSEVARAFRFSNSYVKDKEQKIARYLKQHDQIIEAYHKIIEENHLEKPLALFNSKFDYQLPIIKKLDLIFWSYGKSLKLSNKIYTG